MVSFIANPDIALAREERRLSLAKMLQGYTPPQNPYGYTTAGVFAPLVHALTARWKGQEASGLQARQQEAQAKVLSGVSGAGRARPGPFFQTVDTMGLGAFPGTREAQTQIQRIADDGSVLPPEISAETARTAGIDPLTLKTLMDDAERTGDVATQEAIKREAQKGLAEAVTSKNWSLAAQWEAIVDPSKVLEARQASELLQEERELELAKEDRTRGARELQRWTLGGKPVRLSSEEWENDQDSPSPKYTSEGPEPEQDEKWSGVNFRVTEPFTYKGVDRKVGDEFFVNVRDPAFEPHRNKGVSIKKIATEDVSTPPEGIPAIATASIQDLATMLPPNVDRLLLEDASYGDIGGLVSRTTTAISGFFGGDPAYPAAERTLEEGEQLNTLQTFIMASLARTISPRVPVWSQKIAAKVVPQPGNSNAQNAKRIKALIPLLQKRYQDILSAIELDPDTVDMEAARVVLADLENTIPLLAQTLTVYENRSGGAGTISLSPGSSFSEEKATEAPVGTQIEDIDESTGEARKWEKISNNGPTGEWRRID
jgi:hypothetical protein